MRKVFLTVLILVGILMADGYTLAPDGSYVSGDSATLAPDGTYVGGSKAILTPGGNYIGD